MILIEAQKGLSVLVVSSVFVPEDEMFTDTYKYTVRDDVFYEVHGKVRLINNGQLPILLEL